MYNIPIQPYSRFQFDRAQQINELLVSIPQCRAVSPDRSLLEVPVRLAGGASVMLRITVPGAFPQERPVLSVTAPVQHPWVDSIGRLSLPSLERWSGATMRLAAVVSEAMQGLASASSSSPGALQQAHQARPSGHTPPPPPGPQQSPGRTPSPQKPRLPPPRSTFPELEEMSNSDLAQALTREEAYGQLLQRLLGGEGAAAEGAGAASEVVRQLRGSVEAAARRNLDRESEMAEVRNQIAIIRSSEYAPARAAYDEKARRQQEVLELLSPKVVVQKLQAAAQQAEAESEQLYRAYTEGGLSLEAFVAQYSAKRTLFHQRDLKAQAAVHTIPMDV